MNIEPILDHYGQDYDPSKSGNQQVRCVFHDDKHASASVNLGEGLFNCFTCGIGGDGIELIKIKEGVGFSAAKRIAESLVGEGHSEVRREPDDRGSYVPRRTGHKPGRRRFVSPWARKRP